MPKFAHGAFYMAGAYVSYYMMTSLGVNYCWRWRCRHRGGGAMMLADRLVLHPLRNVPESARHDRRHRHHAVPGGWGAVHRGARTSIACPRPTARWSRCWA
ncbi:hypothetical protein ACU4GD_26910 [Cupriavidus basilensis]